MSLDGSPLIEILLAVILLGGAGYVVARSLAARQRGEDVGEAAAGALRAVGPPVVLAVIGLVALSLVAALAGIFLLIALIAALTGDGDAAGVILLWLSVVGVLFLTVVGAMAWGLIRVVKSGRDRAH